MSAVKALRVADHDGGSRIVLDLTAKTAFTATLSEDGRHLLVKLPATSWTAAAQGAVKSSALVTAYRYADGTLTVDLGKAARLKSSTALPAGKDAGPRLVIDLSAAL